MNDPYLFIALATGPRTIAYLVRQLSAEALDLPSEEGRFSPREVIAHLADAEPLLAARIKQAVDRPGSTVHPFDEGERAVQLNYSGTDIEEQLALFQAERAKTIAMLQGLADADWEQSAVHEIRGRFTVRDQAYFFVCHDQYHVEQLLTMLSA
jgi:uncharacterized damage-inducible protein DinB